MAPNPRGAMDPSTGRPPRDAWRHSQRNNEMQRFPRDYDHRSETRNRSRSQSPDHRSYAGYDGNRGGAWRRQEDRGRAGSDRHERSADTRDVGFRIKNLPGSNELRREQAHQTHLDYQPPPTRYPRRPNKLPPSHPDYEYDGEFDMYDDAPPLDPPYRGENDASTDGKAMKYVLVLDLKEATDETLFAKGLEKLYREADDSDTGATPLSLRRVLLIRDRITFKSIGFGFVEYHTIEDAKAAVHAAHLLGDRMTISSRQVRMAFPHNGCFPHASFGTFEKDDKFTFELNIGTGQKHKYKDERYFASELVLNEESPHDPVTSNTEQVQQQPVKTLGKQAVVETGLATLDGGDPKSKKRKATQAFAAPGQLALWQKKAEEVRGVGDKVQKSREETSKQPSTSVHTTALAPRAEEQELRQSFVFGKSCYLCKTNLAVDKLELHVRESTLHAKNLADEGKVKEGWDFMKRKGIDPAQTLKVMRAEQLSRATSESGEEITERSKTYIDRAALRRNEQAQAASQQVSFSLRKPDKTASQPSTDDDGPAKLAFGKGMNLLQKAGWTAGQGLGASGEGRTDVIDQGLYAAGVGLGHEGSRVGDAVEEAQRMTKGGDGWVEKTREVARKRFEGMQ